MVLAGCCLWMGSCRSGEEADNPTRGTVKIAADEAFQPVIHALTQAYEALYPRAHFEVSYRPEQEAILALLQDSVRMVFVTRPLSENEHAMLLQQASTAKTHKIAVDGVALIVGKENADTLITVTEVEAIFKGEITDWSQLAGSKRSGVIDLIFDDANSSNLLYFKNRFQIGDFSRVRISVAGSNEKVIREVQNRPGSIGFIGMNWISDAKETGSIERSGGIQVMRVAENADTSAYYLPFQEDLSNGKYPFARLLYAISREAHAGLAGGLLTYIARDVGGLLIMKMGLVPTVPYNRDVILKTE